LTDYPVAAILRVVFRIELLKFFNFLVGSKTNVFVLMIVNFSSDSMAGKKLSRNKKSTSLDKADCYSTRTLSNTRPVPRRWLNRVEAAIYTTLSPSKFDELQHVPIIVAHSLHA
jgi:hypothetical protein